MQRLLGIAALAIVLLCGGIGQCDAIDLTKQEIACLKTLKGIYKPTPEKAMKAIWECIVKADSTVENEFAHWRQLNKEREARRTRKLLCECYATDDERARMEAALSKSLRRFQQHQMRPGTDGRVHGPELKSATVGEVSDVPICDLPSGICTVVVTAEEGRIDRKVSCVNIRGEVLETVNNEKWAVEEDDLRPGSSSERRPPVVYPGPGPDEEWDGRWRWRPFPYQPVPGRKRWIEFQF